MWSHTDSRWGEILLGEELRQAWNLSWRQPRFCTRFSRRKDPKGQIKGRKRRPFWQRKSLSVLLEFSLLKASMH